MAATMVTNVENVVWRKTQLRHRNFLGNIEIVAGGVELHTWAPRERSVEGRISYDTEIVGQHGDCCWRRVVYLGACVLLKDKAVDCE